VAAHGLAIDHNGVYEFVRPSDLAACALVEKIAISKQARQNRGNAKRSRQRSYEYGARIVCMGQANPMLSYITPHEDRGEESRRGL
jgi:hypothetical protein